MAKLKVVILDTEKRRDGTVNVKIRVTHNRAVRYVKTEFNILPEFFEEKSGLILPGGKYDSEASDKANISIQSQVGIMAAKIRSLRNLRFMSIADLMTHLRDKHREIDFFAEIDRRIDTLRASGKGNYADSFKTTRNLMKDFYPSAILSFETIDYNFLKRFENYLRERRKLRDSSIGFYMRNIRTIMNFQRDQGQIPWSHNPFHHYKIPSTEPRENMVLTPEEMATIAKVEIREPLMRWARDMYMLCFCLIGINPIDLFFTKNLVNGRLFYTRSKGKKKYSIKVPPQALHIINKYPGKDYLLDTMDRYSDYTTAVKRINYKLKDIAVMCEIKKHLTIYTCRHSWSAYARYLGISKFDIAAALGHKPIELPKVTEFYDYIEEEQRRVDEANKKVIRLILGTPPKKITF